MVWTDTQCNVGHVIESEHIGLKLFEIDAFLPWTEPFSPWALEGMSEQMGKASSVEQAYERGVRVKQQVDEQMAQYSTRLFLNHSIHCAEAI